MRNFKCKACLWIGSENELEYDNVESCMGNDKIEMCPSCGSLNVGIEFNDEKTLKIKPENMQTSDEFFNQVILPDNLAPLEDEQFNELEKKLKLLKHLGTLLFLILFAGGFLLLWFLAKEDLPKFFFILYSIVAILILLNRTLLVLFGFPKKGYLLRNKDISYRRGLFFYKLTTIPLNRIQHVEVSQGFIEKMFNLAKVKIFTAGGSVSDLSIPGLLPEKAHQIESFLLQKISTYE